MKSQSNCVLDESVIASDWPLLEQMLDVIGKREKAGDRAMTFDDLLMIFGDLPRRTGEGAVI